MAIFAETAIDVTDDRLAARNAVVLAVAQALAGGNNTGCQLTSAWGFNASYEHYWTPAWHTSLYGAWYQVSYNNTANAILCSAEGAGWPLSARWDSPAMAIRRPVL